MTTIEPTALLRFAQSNIDEFLGRTRYDSDPNASLMHVAQAITWTRTFDEQVFRADDTRFAEHPGWRYLIGSRVIRNKTLHEATHFLQIDSRGAWFPLLLPAPFFEIIWCPLSELSFQERKPSKEQLDAYADAFSGQPVRFAFSALAELFKTISDSGVLQEAAQDGMSNADESK